eukprot:31113-Pelagococcus_subviridis.AAC.2
MEARDAALHDLDARDRFVDRAPRGGDDHDDAVVAVRVLRRRGARAGREDGVGGGRDESTRRRRDGRR